MNNAGCVMTENLPSLNFEDGEMLKLMKETICKGSTDEEFKIFAYTCKRIGLDPFARQVFAVKRWDSKIKKEVMTIQTGIDGYRLIADRTGMYAPGKPPEFEEKDGKIISATSYVKKLTKDGTWHEVAATAYYSEYVGKTKDGDPTAMWREKPRVMLSKCSESLALRKAFPSELSGIYTKEEMDQAENPSEFSVPVITESGTVEINVDPKPDVCEMTNWIEKKSKLYNKSKILDYIELCCKKLKMNEKDFVRELIADDVRFETKFNEWLEKNG